MDIKREMFGKRIKKKSDIVFHNVIFIDPGLGGTGYAYFDSIVTDLGFAREVNKPLNWGVLHSGKQENWQSRANDLATAFIGLLKGSEPEIVVIESPEVWGDSGKSLASVTRGELLKLTYLVGMFAFATVIATNKNPILVTANEWKGQLPKDVVIKRIKSRYGSEFDVEDHEADAIGMGLSAQNILCKNN